jgi:uncharacterized protein (DUF2235 family)
VAFYDPGVGTFSAPAALTRPSKAVTKVFGLAFGYGITANIGDAYRFLMETYEPDDRIYIFGFSRGAYTARAVAAMLYKCGLLERRNDNLLPYALKLFKYDRRPDIYKGFKRTFSRDCGVHFVGVWDTVSSVGWIYDPLTLQFTMNNPIVKTVRHAIAIDERRCFYRQNLWGEGGADQDVKQVWFAGAHCDVGGGYLETESGPSQIALDWMIEEALQRGLVIDADRRRIVVPSQSTDATEDEPYRAAPDASAELHKSLKGPWWVAEIVPKRYKDPRRDFRPSWRIPLGRRRFMREGSTIHGSVVERMEATSDSKKPYRPPRLPESYQVEPWPGRDEGGGA